MFSRLFAPRREITLINVPLTDQWKNYPQIAQIAQMAQMAQIFNF